MAASACTAEVATARSIAWICGHCEARSPLVKGVFDSLRLYSRKA